MTDSNRVYKRDVDLQTLEIKNTSYGVEAPATPVKLKCLDSLKPLLSSPNAVESYTWNLNYRVCLFDIDYFNVTAPTVSRRSASLFGAYENHRLSEDIPGTV